MKETIKINNNLMRYNRFTDYERENIATHFIINLKFYNFIFLILINLLFIFNI